MGKLARSLLGIPRRERRVAERALGPDPNPLRERFLRIGEVFADGHHAALLDPRPEPLAARLDETERDLRGFAYEGAGMGLCALDRLALSGRDRFAGFAAGAGSAHVYTLYAGAGWALAHLPIRPAALLARLDPLLGWIALNGLGFHHALFHRTATLERGEVPRRIAGYGRRAFDCGVGRCLWFLQGADPARIASAIAQLPEERRGELWSGVGEAAAYAGGGAPETLAALRRAAGSRLPQLAQGAAFSAEARERGGNPTAETALACRALCGTEAATAAAVVRASAAGLPHGGEPPAFEIWRRRIQQRLTETPQPAG